MPSPDRSAAGRSPYSQDLPLPGSPSARSNVPSSRHDSKVSVNTHGSVRSRQEYLTSLIQPTKEQSHQIEMVQERKEEEIIKKRLSMGNDDAWWRALSDEEQTKAAGMIQRNYRGYRARRRMKGMGLDPSSRWVEAVKEAKYRNLLTPKARPSYDGTGSDQDVQGNTNGDEQHKQSFARQNWRKVVSVAKRATGDEDSDVSTNDNDDNDLPEEEREERRRRRAEQKRERQKVARVLDLQYWLEMVDLQHRYGGNLRVYHSEWKKADTNENFFYWLDHGAGRFIDCQGCPRERLDRERVRYLSREERMAYLVKIDKEGRLCWAKNGARIDTTEKYKDSIHGIVPVEDASPAYVPPDEEAAVWLEEHKTTGTGGTGESTSGHHHENAEPTRASTYASPALDKARGVKKIKGISTSTIFDKLLRGSVKKNTWIFAADTSFRLYVGIKQSGAFQHSSFLHGSRISAAGLIKIKDGRLDKLSPLSGHYRPPVSSFRAFVHSLKEAGADMSHLSISRSYAILVGLEAYVKTRRRGKKIVQMLTHGRDRLLSADELRQRREEEMVRNEWTVAERRIGQIRGGGARKE